MTTSALPTSITPLASNLLCMASMMVWAAGLPAVDVLIGTFPALPLTTLRMVLAAAILMPFWIMRDGWGAVKQADWRSGLWVGGMGFGLGAYLLIVAQDHTDAVTVAVIAATMPVVGVALECVLDGRKLNILLLFGMLLSLAGGVLAYVSGLAGMTLGWGALAAFGSVVTFAWASRATVKAFPTLSPLGRTTITLSGAALVTSIVALAVSLTGGEGPNWAAIGPREIATLAFYAFAAMALSQVLWIVAVGNLGIGLAALHINAAPFYVMLILYAFGANWNWTQALGAAIVATGVLIAQRAPNS